MSNDKIENIGKRILTLRRERGLTQDELAARLCITAQAISKWERGVGLPDLAILPALAEALGVNVGTLFGEDEGISASCENEEAAAEEDEYSDDDESDEPDELDELDEFDDAFDDFDKFDNIASSGETSLEKELSGFDSIDLSVAFPCRAAVVISKDGFEGVKAYGTRRFISHLSAEVVDKTLCVKASSTRNWSFKDNPSKNSLTLFIPPSCEKSIKAVIAGNSNINVYANFDKASLNIAGSGSIKSQNCGILKSIISGSGSIELYEVSKSSEISIAGSGDLSSKSLGDNVSVKIAGSGGVTADSAKNITSVITGSGDISIKDIRGDLSCNITGSGDFTCGGSVDGLTVRITGSGDFCGEKLTAKDSNIDISGSGGVTVYRIVKNSIERLSRSASLTVMHRGEES